MGFTDFILSTQLENFCPSFQRISEYLLKDAYYVRIKYLDDHITLLHQAPEAPQINSLCFDYLDRFAYFQSALIFKIP